MRRPRKNAADRKPLAGRRVLVTRAKKQAGKLSSTLRELGATVIEIPSIEIRPPRSYKPLDAALGRLSEYDWLILTSVNGVEALYGRIDKQKLEAAALEAMKICAIGPATKAAIEERGVRVDVVPEKYVAESVVAALRPHVSGKRVLLVRAKVARDVIPLELRRAGARIDVVEAYETVVPKSSRARLQTMLQKPRLRPDVITFTSSSTARNFVDLLGAEAKRRNVLDGIVLASIGPVTSNTLREVGLRADVEASSYTMEGLAQALVATQKA